MAIKLGSPTELKGIEIKPSTILFNDNNVKSLVCNNNDIWKKYVWFDNGVFDNTDTFGNPIYYKTTYLNGNNILFPTTSGTGGDGAVIISNRIPRNMFKRVEVSFVLSSQLNTGQYRFMFGFSNSQSPDIYSSQTTPAFSVSSNMQTYSYDLTSYNSGSSDLYFFIYNSYRAYVYSVTFYY